jgi:hypothetical protein
MSSFRLAATLVVVGGAGLGVALSAQQEPSQPASPRYSGGAIQATHHDLSPALRDIPPNPDAREDAEKGAHAPLRVPRSPRAPAGFRDPLVQESTPAPLLAAPSVSFEGINNRDGVLPPDVNGDAGPNHYVQWVNLSYAVYDKSGARLVGPLSGSQVFTGFGGPCATRNDGDPIALYDELADRWMLSQFALPNYPSGPFYQCIAVSKTKDPTGEYWRYEFKISDTKLNDYPKFGVWPTGYFMSVNQFAGNTFAGAGVVAFERDKMLAGLPARMYYVDTNNTTLGGMLPSDLDGQPPGQPTPNFFMQFDDVPAQLQVWQFDVSWGAAVTGSFTKITELPVAAFDSNMCGYARSCIPQSGTTRKLDAISDRLMYRLQYRNFGGYETFVTNQTVDVNNTDRAGVRWYEVRRTGGAFTVHQQGTWSPDATNRWMASAAMDQAGNLAIAYNASSTTIYPSIRYAARLAGDPLGSLAQGEQDILAGIGSQTSSSSRWGDYSNLAVDPDGCTFWATLEYTNQGSAFSTAPWRTRIAAFTLPGCVSAPTAPSAPALTATASSTNVVLTWTNSTGETNYDVQRCNGNGCTPTTIDTLNADVLTYPDTPDASSSPYTYRVNARNAVGSTSSNTAMVRFPPAPASIAAPSGLTAAPQGKNIRVDWTDNANNESRFELERTGGTTTSMISIGAPNTVRYVDSQVASGTTYSYRVRACDQGTVCSAWSNAASAKAR